MPYISANSEPLKLGPTNSFIMVKAIVPGNLHSYVPGTKNNTITKQEKKRQKKTDSFISSPVPVKAFQFPYWKTYEFSFQLFLYPFLYCCSYERTDFISTYIPLYPHALAGTELSFSSQLVHHAYRHGEPAAGGAVRR